MNIIINTDRIILLQFPPYKAFKILAFYFPPTAQIPSPIPPSKTTVARLRTPKKLQHIRSSEQSPRYCHTHRYNAVKCEPQNIRAGIHNNSPPGACGRDNIYSGAQRGSRRYIAARGISMHIAPRDMI